MQALASRRRRFLFRGEIALIAVTIVAAVAMGAYIALAPFSGYQLAVVAIWLISVTLLLLPLHLERAVLGRSWDWFSPLLYDLVFAYMGILRPLFIAFQGWETAWVHDSPEKVALLLIKTMLIGVIGRVALLIGYYNPLGLRLSKRIPELPGNWDPTRLRLVAVGTIAVALFAYWQMMSNVGGVIAFLNRLAYRRTLLAGRQYMLFATLLIPLAGWMMWAHHLQKKRRVSFPLFLFFAAVLLLMATLGGRGFVAEVVLIALGIFHYLKRRVKLWELVLIGIVAAQFFDVYEDIRQSTISGQLNLAVLEQQDEAFIERVFNQSEGIDRTMVVIDGVPDRIPFQYFTTYTRIITNFIPRRIWPDKPGLTEASVYAPLFGMYTEGKWGVYPAGTVGDFYLQLGVIGVIIGLFIGGVWRRLLYEYLSQHQSNPGAVVFYMLALSSGVFNLRNLGIMQFLARAIPLILLSLFVSGGLGTRLRSSDALARSRSLKSARIQSAL